MIIKNAALRRKQMRVFLSLISLITTFSTLASDNPIFSSNNKLVPGIVYESKIAKPISMLAKSMHTKDLSSIGPVLASETKIMRELIVKNKKSVPLMTMASIGQTRQSDWLVVYAVQLESKVENKFKGFAVQEIPAGNIVKIIHKGPLSEIQSTYKILADYLETKKKKEKSPTWEAYVEMKPKDDDKNRLTILIVAVE